MKKFFVFHVLAFIFASSALALAQSQYLYQPGNEQPGLALTKLELTGAVAYRSFWSGVLYQRLESGNQLGGFFKNEELYLGSIPTVGVYQQLVSHLARQMPPKEFAKSLTGANLIGSFISDWTERRIKRGEPFVPVAWQPSDLKNPLIVAWDVFRLGGGAWLLSGSNKAADNKFGSSQPMTKFIYGGSVMLATFVMASYDAAVHQGKYTPGLLRETGFYRVAIPLASNLMMISGYAWQTSGKKFMLTTMGYGFIGSVFWDTIYVKFTRDTNPITTSLARWYRGFGPRSETASIAFFFGRLVTGFGFILWGNSFEDEMPSRSKPNLETSFAVMPTSSGVTANLQITF